VYSVSLRGWGCEILHTQNQKRNAQISPGGASTSKNRTHKKPVSNSKPGTILSDQLAGGDTMISCPICGFTGQPHKEHRTEETLLSCPHCGTLLKSIPRPTRSNTQDLQTFLEALQNAA